MRVQLLAMKYDPEVAQLYREFVPKYDRRVSLFTEGRTSCKSAGPQGP